jgi:tRNA 2-thiocytidine biosynthesis protein TtcA
MHKTKPKKTNESETKANKLKYFISKKVGQAISDYGMLQDKDKIIVAVSGGKDSLTLLKMLKYRQTFVPIRFDIMAVHIDLGYPCMHPKLLGNFLEKQGINYHIEKVDILRGKTRADITCFWCAWNRRKALFQVADKMGYNKVALGHHFDDIVETVLLNLFYQGQISAMKPLQELFDGKITIIRPLAYVEEKEIIKFTRLSGDFPHEKCSCPNSVDSKRTMIEKVIKEVSRGCPHVKKNIFKSVKRIKQDYLL